VSEEQPTREELRLREGTGPWHPSPWRLTGAEEKHHHFSFHWKYHHVPLCEGAREDGLSCECAVGSIYSTWGG